MIEKRGDIEVRLHKNGNVDEVVVTEGDVCKFHFEQTSNQNFWMRFYGECDLVVEVQCLGSASLRAIRRWEPGSIDRKQIIETLAYHQGMIDSKNNIPEVEFDVAVFGTCYVNAYKKGYNAK